MTEWVDVDSVESFEPGTYRVVDVDDVEVAVFNIDGEFYAIEDNCSHERQCLTDGRIDGEEIICPRHGARFNIKTGEALTAPAYEPVPVMPVRIENGRVQVRDDRWD